jgi:adenylosuccinate synthase
VDPEVLLGEIDYLTEKGVDAGPAKLKISEKAHVIMPYHKAVDHARELMKGDKKIGTTGRGIGPCYEDKATRRGVRFVELLDADVFEERVRSILDEKNFYLKHYLKAETVDPAAVIGDYLAYAERLRPYVDNVSVTIDKAIKAGRQVLFEGAQGTHLDIDHGTYPFVTSSNTVAANACSGTGIVKAYTTRVGAGPFPTELFDAIGDAIQAKGAEFGATTGRRRRCGWLDTVIVRNAVRLNGLTGLAITKLDVLGELDDIKICNAYKYKGETIT